MKLVVYLECICCEMIHNFTEEEVLEGSQAYKIRKVEQVAHQMHEKSGPFYDRWLAAMEARGEQKRCRDCLGFMWHDLHPEANRCNYKNKRVNPGQFACRMFTQYRRDQ